MTVLAFLAVACSCRWNYPDPTPAAMVDGDIITGGYLSYRLRNYTGTVQKSTARRELLEAVITNIIISREAERLSIDRSGNYFANKMKVESTNRFEFVSSYLGLKEGGEDRFHRFMIEKMGLVEKNIDWNEIFPVNSDRVLPDTIQNRGYGENPIISWNHKAAQNIVYSFRVFSLMNKPHSYNVHHLSLDYLISQMNMELRVELRKSDNDKRRQIVRTFLHRYAANDFATYALPDIQKFLIREIEKRSAQELLAEYYRKEFLSGTLGRRGSGAGHDRPVAGISQDSFSTHVGMLRGKANVIVYEGNL